jgi:hypothetical protein
MVLVHHRKAAAAFGQPLAGQFQARIVQALGRYFDCIGARRHPVGDLRSIQGLRNLCLVLGTEVCIQHAVGWAARPQHDSHAGSHGHGDADEQQQWFQACLQPAGGGGGQCNFSVQRYSGSRKTLFPARFALLLLRASRFAKTVSPGRSP